MSASVLIHYSPYWPTRIEIDASNEVVAEVLSQQDIDGDQQWHPMAYLKSIAPAECNYAIHDKELLAIIQALQK